MLRARAQEHVRKAAGGGAHVHADRAAHVEGKDLQRLLQLVRAAADIAIERAAHAHDLLLGNHLSGAFQFALAGKGAALHDEGAGQGEAFQIHFFIEALVGAALFHRPSLPSTLAVSPSASRPHWRS